MSCTDVQLDIVVQCSPSRPAMLRPVRVEYDFFSDGMKSNLKPIGSPACSSPANQWTSDTKRLPRRDWWPESTRPERRRDTPFTMGRDGVHRIGDDLITRGA